MNIDKENLENSILISRNKKYANIIDISLNNIQFFRKFSNIELSLFIYPYNRKIKADSFSI